MTYILILCVVVNIVKSKDESNSQPVSFSPFGTDVVVNIVKSKDESNSQRSGVFIYY